MPNTFRLTCLLGLLLISNTLVLAEWKTYELQDELDDSVTYGCRTEDESRNVSLYIIRSAERTYTDDRYAYVRIPVHPDHPIRPNVIAESGDPDHRIRAS